MLILKLLNLFSHMKVPRLPHGFTYFGIATAGYSAYVAHQEKKKNEVLSKENEQIKFILFIKYKNIFYKLIIICFT